jgi:hypothetical protein
MGDHVDPLLLHTEQVSESVRRESRDTVKSSPADDRLNRSRQSLKPIRRQVQVGVI